MSFLSPELFKKRYVFLFMLVIFFSVWGVSYWLLHHYPHANEITIWLSDITRNFSFLRFGIYAAVFLGWPFLIRRRCNALGISNERAISKAVQYRFRLLLYMGLFEVLIVQSALQWLIGWVV